MTEKELIEDIEILRNLAESTNTTWEIHGKLQRALQHFSTLALKEKINTEPHVTLVEGDPQGK